jgi:hypothetical protein
LPTIDLSQKCKLLYKKALFPLDHFLRQMEPTQSTLLITIKIQAISRGQWNLTALVLIQRREKLLLYRVVLQVRYRRISEVSDQVDEAQMPSGDEEVDNLAYALSEMYMLFSDRILEDHEASQVVVEDHLDAVDANDIAINIDPEDTAGNTSAAAADGDDDNASLDSSDSDNSVHSETDDDFDNSDVTSWFDSIRQQRLNQDKEDDYDSDKALFDKGSTKSTKKRRR